MDYLKIQKKILEKIHKNPYCNIYVQEQGDNICIVADLSIVYIIPKKVFYIDLKHCIKKKEIEKILCLEEQTKEAERTNYLRETDTCLLVKIANETTEVWVNREFLKDFGKNVEFKIIDNKNPVFVYVDKKLAGCVLPVKLSE